MRGNSVRVSEWSQLDLTSGEKNYAREATAFLACYPPHEEHQLVWSQFINVHNKPGRNTPRHLHMEHLSWTWEQATKESKRPNVTSSILQTLGKPGTLNCCRTLVYE